MARMSLIALMLALGGTPVLACDDVCKEGEIYSDSEELCVPAPAQT